MGRITKRVSIVALLLGCCLIFSGCLKTRIVTDQAASAEQAESPWAHGFVNGLVPPINAPLDTEPTCNGAGVSEVYFRQTFVQLVAQGLTSSLYSPQRFTATCAQGGETASAQRPPAYLLEDNAIRSVVPPQPISGSTSVK
ncbi:Bor/Iss family lipoprotein [Salinibacter ruber]|uniref:Bor/Iss family lipoprotein n=1 Tax=Salinibacter ruber TaxID=146919 RepID=UPI00161DD439